MHPYTLAKAGTPHRPVDPTVEAQIGQGPAAEMLHIRVALMRAHRGNNGLDTPLPGNRHLVIRWPRHAAGKQKQTTD